MINKLRAFLVLLSISTFAQVSIALPVIPESASLNFVKQTQSLITFEFDEDKGFYVIENPISKNFNNNEIFGDNALNEDNILRYYIFSKQANSKHDISQKSDLYLF